MTRRDRAQLEAFIEMSFRDENFYADVRIALELDRIASALETMITLMDDREAMQVEIPIKDQPRGCDILECPKTAIANSIYCHQHTESEGRFP